MSVFDELLTKLDAADKDALSAIAARNPTIKEYIGDPKSIRRVDEVKAWYAGNWDTEHNCTREEWARKLKIDALEVELAAKPQGDEMTFAELDKFLDDKVAAGAVVSPKLMKDEINGLVAQKDAEYAARFNALSMASMDAMSLVGRHLHDHNEALDAADLLTKAVEAKATNLREYYETTYAKDKIEAKRAAATAAAEADLTAKLDAARAEGRKAALQEQVGTEGRMPVMDGAPELGHFQDRMTKLSTPKPVEGQTSSVPAAAELGRGQIARAAAMDFERSKVNAGV